MGTTSAHQVGPSGGASGKRRRGEQASDEIRGCDDDGNDDDVEGDGRQGAPGIPSSHKKPKAGIELSCPFRKRNPLRFNVRSHQCCSTQSFRDMTLLK